jgi:hypothetical protein
VLDTVLKKTAFILLSSNNWPVSAMEMHYAFCEEGTENLSFIYMNFRLQTLTATRT